ncbi:MAG: response regulator [Planctomycetota bacterium]
MNETKETILLVEPLEESRKAIEVCLTELGYKLEKAMTTAEALATLAKKAPQLIITAQDLPDQEGLIFRETLLKNKDWAKIPFFLIAPIDDMELRIKAIQQNIPYFILRPVELETLKAQIQAIFSQKAQQDRINEEEKLKTMKQLSVTMNHEIKNHLATILGNAELILMKYPELGPDVEAKLNKIRKAGKSIKQVLDNLNMLSKITTTLYVSKIEMLKLTENKDSTKNT